MTETRLTWQESALKAAFAELCRALGGFRPAARVPGVRVSWQRLQQYASPADEHAECFPTADVIVALEAEAERRLSRPFVTEFLADALERDVVRRDKSTGRDCLRQLSSEVTCASAELIAKITRDVADGIITEQERHEEMELLETQIEKLQAYHAALGGQRGDAIVLPSIRSRAGNDPSPSSSASSGARK
ncbi:hypothetical protein SAMN05216548_10724 [Faunimonas pinastri]|uniref:Uncharacterized protein n=1 Tax=Faunimonas pinastri TaxID=1855383 RepID=A0A1H9I968_9HYPH|nr:hypothetical protein [Faunimonas pinastri]SEQ71104.1 hypothetical protein SAMN05216548_10724 [Faunimonas pinastri]